MERLKTLAKVFEVDERNLCFVDMDTLSTWTVEKNYAELISITLNVAVPQEVRSLFTTAQNTSLYGWYSYDLYAIAQFLSLMCLEMALRLRFPVHKKKDGRSLERLLDKAIAEQLIDQSGDVLRKMRNNLAHPRFQTILMPSDAFSLMRMAADFINRLFANP
jgi:hypothetical protein